MENNTKSMKKTNSRQFGKMVELMEQNPTIATGLGKFGSTRSSSKEAWETFAVQLNALGPPLREGKEWHKVWLDFRLKTKKKLSTIRKETIQTGGGPYRQLSLSSLEQSVDALLNMRDAAAPSGQYFGANTVSQNETIPAPISQDNVEAVVPDEEQDEEERVNDENSPPERRTNRQGAIDRDIERIEILKKQTDTQTEVLQNLKSLEKDLHEIARYTRKMYDLKKEKIAILKAKEERKNRESLESTRRHKEKLELKLKLLEIKKLKYRM